MNRKRLLIMVVTIVIAVPLLILACTTPEPEPPADGELPVIHSLAAGADSVLPLESIQVVCIASAPGGAALSYEWWTSGGEIAGQGAAVVWTAPGSDGTYNIKVTVRDGRGHEATASVSVTVEAEKVNQPPIINSLTADADWAFPGGSLVVTCSAHDPDGHPLSYEWSASAGHINLSGPVVTWVAAQEVGTYSVTVVVSDGHGGSASATLPVSVMPDQPPDIQKLEVTKDRYLHCYLIEYSWGYKVGKQQKYDIECIVSDTGVDLFYEWSCDAGEISEASEDGSMISWIAPNTAIYLTITVTVSDIVGNSATKSVDLQVVSCSPCTFGGCG